ncbi:acyl--CoA ligase [Herbidospora galbida]|uniref:Acyl--CoA ligase n=1 Tax=Herbidospora galbida TaxID=2575442 RepID=A0A4U3MF66_9ACTN|nr:class I adenylate-forming enzyme family protein [Herbidospora galbida]TKK87199.1 acyl--CoA ligase [Herbidospora galbida]
MDYRALTPAGLLTAGFDTLDSPWRARWEPGDHTEFVQEHLPPEIDFATSGSTGAPQVWRRRAGKVWAEAGLLAELVAPEEPGAVLSFAPTVHLYGALTSVLMPAWLGVPVWHRTSFFGAMPALPTRRVVVVATPWIFKLLLEHLDWVRSMEHVTVLYGGAMLPGTAGELLDRTGRTLIVEVMGSTEAGGIATRRWSSGEPPAWTLFRDVDFHGVPPKEEAPLVVTSPRLAYRPGGEPPAFWEADDHVEVTGPREFLLTGRRSRLVKVNGRRINLDLAEHAAGAVLDCADLAVVAVTDPVIGEHVDLLVVLRPGTELADLDLPAAFERLGVRPRRVRAVPEIERSAMGKATTKVTT